MISPQVAPKAVAETRLERIDLSSYVQAGQSFGTPTGVATVYTGNDPSPAILGAISISGNTLLVTEQGGVAGTIYQINVSVPLTNPTEILSVVYLLAVVPDQQ